MIQDVAIPSIGIGRTMYEVVIGTFAAVFCVGKIVEFLRFTGLMVDKTNGNGVTAKNVGRLHVESLKTIVRHEMRDMIQPVIAKNSEYHAKLLDKIEEGNRSLVEIATILRERHE